MEEITRDNEIRESEEKKINDIKVALSHLENKTNKFLFFVTSTNNPAASIYEIYNHATIVKKMGYSVTILTDTSDYEKPIWIESELTDLPHESITDIKLTVGPSDVLIIPEIFSNIMEQTQHLPCIRVGLLQSIDYCLNALIPATDWNSFGINRIITTSEVLKGIFEEFYGSAPYKINVYSPSIPNYFNENGEMKRPVISIVGRNPNEISKVVKLFYAKYPQYTWIGFDSMVTEAKPPQPLDRKNYAERLKTNFASIWIDRISSFGTFPLECMKAGSIPVGIVPDVIPEYLIKERTTNDEGVDELKFREYTGIWTNELYRIPILIGDLVTKFLDDTIDNKVYDTMKELASNYTPEKTEKQLNVIYNEIIEERVNLFKTSISEYEGTNKKKVTKETVSETK